MALSEDLGVNPIHTRDNMDTAGGVRDEKSPFAKEGLEVAAHLEPVAVRSSQTTQDLGTCTEVPSHVAIIMDGNGRWAQRRFLTRVKGHHAGAKSVRMVVEESRRLGVRYLTLFTFSAQNWRRPRSEVAALMRLFEHHLLNEITLLKKHRIRLRAIGDRELLPSRVCSLLERVEGETEALDGMDLILALSYGGREEIVSATKLIAAKAARGELSPNSVDQELFSRHLYAPDVPDPDLLIRTSGEKRISNFLLWQLAYSEIVVTPVLWPAFSREDFLHCLEEYRSRQRRFGLTGAQVASQGVK